MKVIASVGLVSMVVAQSATGNVRVRTTTKPASAYAQGQFVAGETILAMTGTQYIPGQLGADFGNLRLAPGSPDYVGQSGAAFWGGEVATMGQSWVAPSVAQIYQPAWNNWEPPAVVDIYQPAWNNWEPPAVVEMYQPAWNWEAQAPGLVDEWWNAAAPAWTPPAMDEWWNAPAVDWNPAPVVEQWWNAAPAVDWNAPAWNNWEAQAPVVEEWWNAAPTWTPPAMDWNAPIYQSIYQSAPQSIYGGTFAMGEFIPAPTGTVVGSATGSVRVRTTSRPASAYGQGEFMTGETILSMTGTQYIPGQLGGQFGNLQLAAGSPDYTMWQGS